MMDAGLYNSNVKIYFNDIYSNKNDRWFRVINECNGKNFIIY